MDQPKYACPHCGEPVGKGQTRLRYTCPSCYCMYTYPVPYIDPTPKPLDIEPIRAWKVATIHYDRDGKFIGFEGVVNGSYKPVDEAVCVGYLRWHSHEDTIPVADCSCGFYALKAPPVDQIRSGVDWVMLEVELYGKIIVASEGYRAQKQRVIAVYGMWNQDDLMDRCGATSYTWNEQGALGLVEPCTNKIAGLVDGIPYCKAHIVHRKGERTAIERVKPKLGNLEFHWLN